MLLCYKIQYPHTLIDVCFISFVPQYPIMSKALISIKKTYLNQCMSISFVPQYPQMSKALISIRRRTLIDLYLFPSNGLAVMCSLMDCHAYAFLLNFCAIIYFYYHLIRPNYKISFYIFKIILKRNEKKCSSHHCPMQRLMYNTNTS